MTTDDEKISSLYKQGNNQVPPAHLDSAILNAAHEAVAGKDKKSASAAAKSPFSGGWQATAAIAAVLIITVILVPVINREAPPEPSRFAGKSPALLSEQDSINGMNVYQDDLANEPEVKKRLKTVMPAMQRDSRLPQKMTGSSGSALLAAGKTESARPLPAERPGAAMQPALPERSSMPAAAAVKSKAAEDTVQKLNLEAEPQTTSGVMAFEEMPGIPTAKEWLKNIRKLIDQGNLESAREQFEKFKVSYPNEEVDPVLLNQLKEQ